MENNTEKNEQRYNITCRECGHGWKIRLPNDGTDYIKTTIAFGLCMKCGGGLDIVDMKEEDS